MIDRLSSTRAFPARPDATPAGGERTAQSTERAGQSSGQLSPADQRQVLALQRRDREVRAHEMAHVAAGGGLVRSGASFTYQTGPDGQQYAIGGEVGIDTSPGRTPAETRAKAERIKAAALAPADPSPQDRQVAAMATRMAMQASMEQAIEQAGESAVNGALGTESPAAQAGPMRAAYAAVAGEGRRESTVSLFA
ncbi:MAG: putative metalloprotease CJM1_0395 family protein [Candidatus Accumulibacter sp. UW26]|jgi:hypothetical protein